MAETDELVEKGFEAFNSEQYEDAVCLFEQALDLNPDNVAAYSGIACTMIQINKYDEALGALSYALTLDHKNIQLYSDRGFTYELMELYDLANEDYDQAIELDPNCFDAYFGKGRILAFQGCSGRAIFLYNTARKINPHDAQLYYLRAIAYHRLKKISKAAADMDQAIQLDPSHGEYYFYLGKIKLLELHDVSGALLDFKKAASLGREVPKEWIQKMEKATGQVWPAEENEKQ